MPALVTYGHAEELLLDDFGIQDTPVQVIDIPPALGAWFPDLPIHGILGTGVFSRFRTTLDYRSGYLRLETHGKTGDSQLENGQRERLGAPLWLAENQLLLTCIDRPARARSGGVVPRFRDDRWRFRCTQVRGGSLGTRG